MAWVYKRNILLYRARAAEREVAQLLGKRSHHGGRLERNGMVHSWCQNWTLEAATKGKVSWQHPVRLQEAVVHGCQNHCWQTFKKPQKWQASNHLALQQEHALCLPVWRHPCLRIVNSEFKVRHLVTQETEPGLTPTPPFIKSHFFFYIKLPLWLLPTSEHSLKAAWGRTGGASKTG